MIIKFLTIYWPSSVSPKGKLVKHTSGNRTNGKNVPGICINNKIIDKIEKISNLKKLQVFKPEVKNYNINKKSFKKKKFYKKKLKKIKKN